MSPTTASTKTASPKIALVGIDGLRIDLARGTGKMPTLDAVIEQGVFNELVMEVPTLSGPGWSTLLTGSTHAEHGVKDNKFIGHTLLHRPDFLSRAYFADQSTTTMAAAGWPPLVDPADAGPVLWERREQQRSGHHRVISRDGETYGYQTVDAQIADHAVDVLSAKGPDVSFIYFCDADDEGHVYGPHTPEYSAAMDRIEGHLARIKQAIARRVEELGEDWYLVLTTDHGHVDAGGHGSDSAVERASFVAATRFGGSLEHWPEALAPHGADPAAAGVPQGLTGARTSSQPVNPRAGTSARGFGVSSRSLASSSSGARSAAQAAARSGRARAGCRARQSHRSSTRWRTSRRWPWPDQATIMGPVKLPMLKICCINPMAAGADPPSGARSTAMRVSVVGTIAPVSENIATQATCQAMPWGTVRPVDRERQHAGDAHRHEGQVEQQARWRPALQQVPGGQGAHGVHAADQPREHAGARPR